MKIYTLIIISAISCRFLVASTDQKPSHDSTEINSAKNIQQEKKELQPANHQGEITRQIEEDMQKEIDALVEAENRETEAESNSLSEELQKIQQEKDDHVEQEFKKEIVKAPQEQTTLQTFDQVYENINKQRDINEKEN